MVDLGLSRYSGYTRLGASSPAPATAPSPSPSSTPSSSFASMLRLPSVYSFLGVESPFDTQLKLVTSPVFSPFVLASIRLLLALYTFATALGVLIWDGIDAKTANDFAYFSYFTDLSYIGLCAYYWASGVQTLLHARNGGQKGYPLQSWSRFSQFLHLLLFSTITTFPLVVTIVYWSILSTSSTFSSPYHLWSNISQHALNTPFALFEVFLTNARPTPWTHLPIMIVLLACYLGVVYITHDTQGFYTYSFLDTHKQGSKLAAYIVGIAIGECILFALARYVMIARDWLARRYASGGSSAIGSEPLDEWEEVDRPTGPDIV